MRILVVSGFLGAGKTTFIQELSRRSGVRFAVMENEYGSGVDGAVLQNDRLKVWEMTEGCICCSLKSDFALSVLTIANGSDFEFLVIEPTGLGLLSSVLSNISKIEYEQIGLAPPVTIVDINCLDFYLQTFKDFYKDQIINAARIILSKTEEAATEKVEEAKALLHKLNPKAEIISAPYSKMPETWWQGLFETSFEQKLKAAENTGVFNLSFTLPDGYGNSVETEIPGIPDLQTLCINSPRLPSLENLYYALQAVMGERFGCIYRLKGFADVNGLRTKIDVVNKQFVIESCIENNEIGKPVAEHRRESIGLELSARTKIVIIGRDLNKEALKSLFIQT